MPPVEGLIDALQYVFPTGVSAPISTGLQAKQGHLLQVAVPVEPVAGQTTPPEITAQEWPPQRNDLTIMEVAAPFTMVSQ